MNDLPLFPYGLRQLAIRRITPALVSEVQTVTITGTPTGGTFTLTFEDQTTATIAYNASSGTVQTALRALANIGSSGVNVSGSAGGPYTVTFVGGLAGLNVALLTADASGLTGGSSPAVGIVETTPGAGAVILPAAQTLKFMERLVSAQLKGNDQVVSASSFVEAVEWELSNGGIPLEAYAIMTGRSLTESGSTPSRTSRLRVSGGDTYPYFIVYGKSMGDSGDDVHVKLRKCKLTSGMDGTLQGENYFVSALKGIALDDGVNGIADIVHNETAALLPA